MTKSPATGVIAKPGDTIGILGGGQLGRMLAIAAADLGLDVHIFTPEEDSPASRVARKTWVAPFDDRMALREFAAQAIARFKAPRAIAFCDAVRRHASGKPDYAWARAVAADATTASGGAS